MKKPHYPFHSVDGKKFFFTSEGKKTIDKVVEFSDVGLNVWNLGFGDVLPCGNYDDVAVSDNGDLVMIMSTIVQIVLHFSARYPDRKIMISGSSDQRLQLYGRILKTHHADFEKIFDITMIVKESEDVREIIFQPDILLDPFFYFIQRKS